MNGRQVKFIIVIVKNLFLNSSCNLFKVSAENVEFDDCRNCFFICDSLSKTKFDIHLCIFHSKYLDRKRRELPPDNERKNGMKFKNSALHEAKYRDERI